MRDTSEILGPAIQARLQDHVSYRLVKVPLAVGLVTLRGEARSAAVPWASGLADLGTEVGLLGVLWASGRNTTAQALGHFTDKLTPGTHLMSLIGWTLQGSTFNKRENPRYFRYS